MERSKRDGRSVNRLEIFLETGHGVRARSLELDGSRSNEGIETACQVGNLT